MQDIVDELGCSKSLPYVYFRNKRELLQKVCDRRIGILSEMVHGVMADANGPLESLKAALQAVYCFRHTNKAFFQAVQPSALLSLHFLRNPRGTAPDQLAELIQTIRDRLQMAQRQKLIRTDLSPDTLLMFIDATAFTQIGDIAQSPQSRATLLWELTATGLQGRVHGDGNA
jgi:AcrR family transcriptional regulator